MYRVFTFSWVQAVREEQTKPSLALSLRLFQ